MNARQRGEALKELGECYPALRLGALKLGLEALDRACPEASWELGLPAAGLGRALALRAAGPEAAYASWLSRAPGAWGAAAALPPAAAGWRAPGEGLPWLSLVWDGAQDKALALSFFGRARGVLRGEDLAGEAPRGLSVKRAPFSARALEGPLAEALGALAGLCPIKDCVSETGGAQPRFGLRLARPVPAPHFLRLDAAKSCAERGTELAFLLRDRRLTEVALRGEDTWLYLRGAGRG